jgi:hypothetical protein
MALIGWWPLNGNTNDYSGQCNYGVNNNVTWTDGKIGQAAYFNGIDSNIELGVIEIADYDWSLSLWFYSNDITKHIHFTGVPNQDPGGWAALAHFGVFNSKLAWWDSNGWRYGDTTLLENKWYHVIIMVSNEKVFFYLDGLLDGEYPFLSSGNPLGRIGSLGYREYSDDKYFDGKMNDVRIYDHLLSQREINELTQAKILHYSFNKDEDIVYDISGLKNHGSKNQIEMLWEESSQIGRGSLIFNGINDYINLPFTPENSTNFDYTITIDFIINSFSSSDMRIVSAFSGSTSQFSAGWSGNIFRMWLGKTWQNTNFSSSVNTPYRIAIVHSGTITYLYVNGVLNSTILNKTSYFNNLKIGIPLIMLYGSYFDGKVSDFRIYKKALSDIEIKNLYQTRAKIDDAGNLYVNEIEELDMGEEIPIKENRVLHLDASLEETLTVDLNNKVSQWDDISGNNNHVYQTIESRRPVLADDTLYGRKTVRYSATTNVMLSSTNQLDLTNGYTIVFLSKNRVSRDWNGIIGLMNDSTNSTSALEIYWQNGGNSGNFITVFDKGNAARPESLVLNTCLPTADTYYVGVSSGGATNGFIRTVGVQRDIKYDDYRVARAALAHIGIGYYRAWLDGDISEIIVYDKQLEISEIEEIEDYLTRKWLTEEGIQTSGGNSRVKENAILETGEYSEIDEIDEEVKMYKDRIKSKGSLKEGW